MTEQDCGVARIGLTEELIVGSVERGAGQPDMGCYIACGDPTVSHGAITGWLRKRLWSRYLAEMSPPGLGERTSPASRR